MIQINKSERRVLFHVFMFYSALVFNIFLGWVVAKLNTHYLTVAEYGRYSFYIIFIYMSLAFFGFGFFESTSRLLAVTGSEQGKKQLLGAGLFWAVAFFIPLTIMLFIASFFSDQIFNVKISSLLYTYAPFSGLILLSTYLSLALRGMERINMISLLTVLPRMIYIVLLIFLVYFNRFSLTASLEMFYAGFLFSAIICIISVRPKFSQIWAGSKQIFEEVKTYGIHLYVSNVWHEIFFHSDKFIVSYFLPAESIAYYALGYMITYPLTNFSFALATTLFRKFSAQDRINHRVFLLNGAFVIISVSVLILLRKYIIFVLFSEKYAPVMDLIIPLAIAFGFSAFSKPFTLYLMARKYGKTVRNISVIVPLVHISLALYVIPVYGIIGAAWIAALVYFLDLVLYMFSYIRVLAKVEPHHS